MNSVATYDVGAIVNAGFPFTDRSGEKPRPLLILAVLPHGRGVDYLGCAITTQDPPDPHPGYTDGMILES